MADLPTPAPPSPGVRPAGAWAVRLAIALFVASLALPAFWFRFAWDGGWLWGWQVMLLGLTGFRDEVGLLVFAAFPLAAVAYLGGASCFLVTRYRASVALAILSLLLVIGLTALMAVTELSEGIGPGRERAWMVGPGQIIWVTCPAITLWQAWRARRNSAGGLVRVAGVADQDKG
jgi:hypothetical protein